MPTTWKRRKKNQGFKKQHRRQGALLRLQKGVKDLSDDSPYQEANLKRMNKEIAILKGRLGIAV